MVSIVTVKLYLKSSLGRWYVVCVVPSFDNGTSNNGRVVVSYDRNVPIIDNEM